MIHQHIFASPRPGLTEAEFQRYWLEVHAVQYASKIKQIKKYKVDTRVDWAGQAGPPLWNGVAEIWLRNEQEQLESLQSPEFLEGARLDEPRWAAFWNTLVLDCDSFTVVDRMGERAPDEAVKLLVLVKRKPGLELEAYRRYHRETHAPLVVPLPGLLRYDVAFTRDSWYAVGEPRFDGVAHLWFESLEALNRLPDQPHYRELVAPDGANFLDRRYVFRMAVREHWIIGPEPRD